MSAAAMQTPLLPDWIKAVWTLALVVVFVIHARHFASTRGRMRWWHLGHIATAVGMIVMYVVPQQGHPILHQGSVAAFGAYSLSSDTVATVIRGNEGIGALCGLPRRWTC